MEKHFVITPIIKNILIVDECSEIINLFKTFFYEKQYSTIETSFQVSSQMYSVFNEDINAVLVNADPRAYKDILKLRDTISRYDRNITVVMMTTVTWDKEIFDLQSSGWIRMSPLDIEKIYEELVRKKTFCY